MIWINFLHLYQPANIESYSIRKALDKSYWRLIRLMEENPNLRMTWNVSGCLLERLADEQETKWLERLKFLVKKGRLELTGSAAYHGFLPLLPEAEVVKQIRTNEKILRQHFGKGFKPTGFFLPEMAYSPVVARLVKRLGYSWIILDEIAYSGDLRSQPDINTGYQDKASGLKVVFRNRLISSSYPPDVLRDRAIKNRQSDNSGQAVIITATDAELYGLRHEDPTAELEKLVRAGSYKTATVSAYLKANRKKLSQVKIIPSSWESTPIDIKKGRPYILWSNPKNNIQTDLWCLAYLALEAGDKFKGDKNFYWHRWHLVRGLASCVFWWASAHDFSKIFGPYAWSPNDVERGLEDLIRSIRSLEAPKSKRYKLAAEKYYLRIKKLIWQEHWRKHWQKTI